MTPLRALAALVATAALAACGEPTPPPTVRLMKEGDPMSPTATTARPGVPPIDAAVPSKLETATFALG